MRKSIVSAWTRFKNSYNRAIDVVLQGTHNHYRCYLPEEIGKSSSNLLKLFYSGIELNPDETAKLRKLPKDSIVVYATKHKSYFEYLFYYTRYRLAGLKFPEIGLDYPILIWQPLGRVFRILVAHLDYLLRNLSLQDPYESGFIRQELANGRTAMVSLIEKKGFYRRFVKDKADPLRYLIELQRSTDRPVVIVPQLMFFGKKPAHSVPSMTEIMFGSELKPGNIRRLATLFRAPENIFVEVSPFMNIRDFLAQPENQDLSAEYLSVVLRRQLLRQINRHRQSIVGPVLKSREELKENILTHTSLQKFMNQYAEKKGVPIHRVHKKANAYLEEIAAKYNIGIISVLSSVVRWFLNTMFDGVTIDQKGLSRVKEAAQKGPLILIPCHKSHIDYLILSYVLFHNNMPCPLIAAGKNLSFWPMGPLFRGAGAFFIRRTFKGAALYSKIFSTYIYKLLEEGFNIEFFIEGGRSRTGKLILPKLGLLSIIIDAFQNGAANDLMFAPIFIGYDRVIEESAYLHELEGGQKKPESIGQVLKARKFLSKRHGKIYINFHEPVSFKDLLEQNRIDLDQLSKVESRVLIRNLGYRIINAINRVSVVTPHSVVAGAILNCRKNRFSLDHLMEQIDTFMTYLSARNAQISDSLVMDVDRSVEQVMDNFIQSKFIEKISLGKEAIDEDPMFSINENKRPNLEYYKNNSIAFFIPAAFTALAILKKDAFQFTATSLKEEYEFLQDLFKNEFAYDIDRSSEYYIRKNIKAFTDDAILSPHQSLPDAFNVTSAGFRKLNLFAGFLRPYLESYWVALNYFKQTPKSSIELKDRLKKIETLGSRMYKREEIERKEAMSKVNYKNAANYFMSRGVIGAEDEERIDHYTDELQGYLELIPS